MGQTLTQSQQTKTAGQYLIRSMREGWQQLASLSLTRSLARSLSAPFSTCLSRSLSVPASHLPLMSPVPCAQSCLSSTPLASVSAGVYFSPHVALFGTARRLPANHFYCLGICVCFVCVCDRERRTCVCPYLYHQFQWAYARRSSLTNCPWRN